MLRAQRSPVQETAEETAEGVTKDDVAVTPLAMPMLAGPGALSTMILLDTQAQTWAHRAILYSCLAAVGIASYVTFMVVGRGAHWLSPIAIKIIARLMGLLLAAVAIQFIFNAIKGEGDPHTLTSGVIITQVFTTQKEECMHARTGTLTVVTVGAALLSAVSLQPVWADPENPHDKGYRQGRV